MAYERLEITKLANIWVTFYEYDSPHFVLQLFNLQKIGCRGETVS